MYIDVHTHLTHEKFNHDLVEVISRAKEASVTMVVNGLEPNSNRQILQLAADHEHILPALGIYPLDAINHLPEKIPFPIKPFDVDQEISFIAEKAKNGEIAAVGECGLDGHWVDSSTFADQERVFVALIEIAKSNDLPIIIHTRKLENVRWKSSLTTM